MTISVSRKLNILCIKVKIRAFIIDHQHMEFTFHNSFVIPGIVPITVIFWTAKLLTQKLLKKGYVATRLKSLQKLYGRHHNLVDRYEISISQMTMNLLLFT
jgi:hypothetical protein